MACYHPVTRGHPARAAHAAALCHAALRASAGLARLRRPTGGWIICHFQLQYSATKKQIVLKKERARQIKGPGFLGRLVVTSRVQRSEAIRARKGWDAAQPTGPRSAGCGLPLEEACCFARNAGVLRSGASCAEACCELSFPETRAPCCTRKQRTEPAPRRRTAGHDRL